MRFDLTTGAGSLFHVMLTFPSLNEISLDLKTNKHISPPVSPQIMPVTYELNFLSKHIFIGGTLSLYDGKCHRCWSLIKNMIMSISCFKNPLTMQWNESRSPNRVSHILRAYLWCHSSPIIVSLSTSIMLCMCMLFWCSLNFILIRNRFISFFSIVLYEQCIWWTCDVFPVSSCEPDIVHTEYRIWIWHHDGIYRICHRDFNTAAILQTICKKSFFIFYPIDHFWFIHFTSLQKYCCGLNLIWNRLSIMAHFNLGFFQGQKWNNHDILMHLPK